MNAVMQWARRLGVVLVIGLGCDAPQALDGGVIIGEIDAYRLCDVNGVDVRLVARWLDCAAGEPDCEPPPATTREGDRFSCPSAEGTRDLGVELPDPGVYRIEVHTAQASGPAKVECFVDPDSGEDRVELSATQVREGAAVMLDDHGTCPER
ncbi:MAG: hypothetical protein AAGF11_27020 [Myxococcota bacterium]